MSARETETTIVWIRRVLQKALEKSFKGLVKAIKKA